MEVVEAEKRLLIALSAGAKPLEYRWDEKRFILPPGEMATELGLFFTADGLA